VRPFAYTRAACAADAVALVSADPDAMFLGGGTNVVDHLRLGLFGPGHLVDVSALHTGVEPAPDGGLRLGAGVTNSEAAASPLVRTGYPAVSQALLSGASGQLRNMATVGGNLLQRTRCRYFQDPAKPCNKRRPGSGCPARAGISRDLAIIGTSPSCIASHPSDFAVALAAMDAVVLTRGPGGDRRLPLDEFYRLPRDDPSRDTVLEHGELIVAVELPPPTDLTRGSRYRKARDRASFAFALGAVAGAILVRGDAVADVRLAFGAIAPRPWRARSAEQAILGGQVDAAAFRRALEAEFAEATPTPENAFKRTLAVRMGVGLLSELSGLDAHVDRAGQPR
jgi:xanthine dehydrogenase YagS FAD-binding subunit